MENDSSVKTGKSREKLKHFINKIKVNIYGILYFIVMSILSVYIIVNWDKCISMKFFDQFNGNNILFIVWIALIVLFFYDVEAKGFKFQRKKYVKAMEQFSNAESIFIQNQIKNIQNPSSHEHPSETKERSNNNELSRQTVDN